MPRKVELATHTTLPLVAHDDRAYLDRAVRDFPGRPPAIRVLTLTCEDRVRANSNVPEVNLVMDVVGAVGGCSHEDLPGPGDITERRPGRSASQSWTAWLTLPRAFSAGS